MGLTLVGCAQPPLPKDYHVSNYQSNLGKRLDISVNYHLNGTGAIVVVDIANPRGYDYRYWMVQVSATDGQRVIAARRFYQGAAKKHQEIFRLPLPEEGLTETFYVEVFDIKGTLVMKSEPIKNSPIGG